MKSRKRCAGGHRYYCGATPHIDPRGSLDRMIYIIIATLMYSNMLDAEGTIILPKASLYAIRHGIDPSRSQSSSNPLLLLVSTIVQSCILFFVFIRTTTQFTTDKGTHKGDSLQNRWYQLWDFGHLPKYMSYLKTSSHSVKVLWVWNASVRYMVTYMLLC